MSKTYWRKRIEEAFGGYGYGIPNELRERLSVLRKERRPQLLKDAGAEAEWRKLRELESKVQTQKAVICEKLTAYADRLGLPSVDTNDPGYALGQLEASVVNDDGVQGVLRRWRDEALDILHRAQTHKETRDAIAKVEAMLAEYGTICHDTKALETLLSQCMKKRDRSRPEGMGLSEKEFFSTMQRLRAKATV